MVVASCSTTCSNTLEETTESSRTHAAIRWEDTPLVGCSQQVAVLREVLHGATSEQNHPLECALLYGLSGTGKSLIVKEVLDTHALPILVGMGKYDQVSELNKPYGAIISATTQLLVTFRIRKKADVIKKVASAFSKDDTELLSGMVPGFEMMQVGKRRKHASASKSGVRPVHNESASLKFMSLIRKLWRVISSPDCPCVMVLDDLQWADDSSRNLLAALLNDSTSSNFVLIGTVREGEGTTFTAPVDGCVPVKKVDCRAFAETEVTELVSAILKVNPSSASTANLASLLYERTGGNPYFIKQFIEAMVLNKLIAKADADGEYSWDIESAKMAIEPSANVVDLLIRKIENVEAKTQMILVIASALGHTFRKDILESVLGSTELISLFPKTFGKGMNNANINIDSRALKKGLKEATKIGLVEIDTENAEAYHFTHDRVQQAAASMFPGGDIGSQMKAAIGVILLATFRSSKTEPWMLSAATILLINHSQHAPNVSRREIALLCLEVAELSAQQTAFHEAAKFADHGIHMLSRDCWKGKMYDLTLSLFTLSAEAHRCALHVTKAKKRIKAVQKYARDVEDGFRTQLVLMEILFVEKRYPDILTEAYASLPELGARVPSKPGLLSVVLGLVKTKRILKGRKPSDLVSLPRTEDAKSTQAIELLTSTAYAAWHLGKTFNLLLGTLGVLEQTLMHGVGPLGGTSFAMYGMTLTHLGDYKQAYEFGELAMKTAVGGRDIQWVMIIVAGFLCHLERPMSEAADLCLKGYFHATQTGEMTKACTLLFMKDQIGVMTNSSLEDSARGIEASIVISQDFKQDGQTIFLRIWLDLVQRLMGESNNNTANILNRIAGQGTSDGAARQQKDGEALSLMRYQYDAHTCRTIYLYLAGRYEEAEADRKKHRNHEDDGPTSFKTLFHCVFLALNCYALARKSSKYQRAAKRYVKALRKYADSGSINGRAFFTLVNAERLAVNKKTMEAVEEFKCAIALLKEGKFHLMEAMAHERLGAMLVEQKDRQDLKIEGITSLVSAKERYESLRAFMVVERMQRSYAAELR